MGKAETVPQWLRRRFRIHNRLATNCLAEFVGTFFLVFVGSSISCQWVLSGGALGSFLQAAFGGGLVVTLVVYGCFYTSGGHVNAAISFMFFSLGMMKFTHFLLFSLSQVLGAFAGFAGTYHLYGDMLHKFAGNAHLITGSKATAFLFANFPAQHISNYTALMDSVMATACLCFIVCVLGDPRNKVPLYLFPLIIGLEVFAVVSAFGLNTGVSINPSANFGGRVFLLVAGYGWEVFTYHNYWFWIPLIGPFIGAPLGAFVYHISLGIHIPDDGEIVAGEKGEKENEMERVVVAKHSIHSQINSEPDDMSSTASDKPLAVLGRSKASIKSISYRF